MVTREAILDALRPVQDPEVHKSIVELGMVREVEINGDHANVEVVLTISGCPLRNKIDSDVREALGTVAGLKTFDLKLGTMTDEERAKFRSVLRGGQSEEEAITPALLAPDTKTQFVAVASGKGGVGKSTVTANLAVAMARQGFRVGIIDADIYGFSIPGIFGIGDKKPTVIDNLLLPVIAHDVKIISMHFFVPDNRPVIWRGPMLGKMLRNFFAEVHWGDIDVLLLDMPPGTGDMALDIHQLLPKSKEIIVTTPQQNATEVAARVGTMAIQTQHDILGVVENMSFFEHKGEKHYIFGKGGGERLALELKTDLLSQIPLGVANETGDGIYDADSAQGLAYAHLAKTIGRKLEQGVTTGK
ncbi:Mrp/NBP35 family ATP-binding protein [Tumebacillus sp. ITR2]|uniref:Iron-sulfur cluster carrier protein n=1 Tax=Tumebacillus amylolyticus TaxID=2801339 RepID=A0ABS1JGI6_9BACL|nr:Mrp/NBP35 family ATP-binding protein [Tumebacillus amylolyticus]MBL0389373.1 Mrp/NBP35 family ATP-binding protein [Tumebacillus amylolyticus]